MLYTVFIITPLRGLLWLYLGDRIENEMIQEDNLTQTAVLAAGLEEFIQLLPDIALVVDQQGWIVHRNAAAATLFPTAESWLKALPPTAPWPPPEDYALEMALTGGAGKARVFQVHASNAQTVRGSGYFLVLHEITEWKKRDQEQAAVLAVTEELGGVSNRVQVFTTVLNKLESLLAIDRAAILSTSGNSGKFSIEFVRGLEWEYVGQEIPPDSPLVELIAKRESVWLPDIHDNPCCLDPAMTQDMRSGAIFPLAVDENQICALALTCHNPISRLQFNQLEIIAGAMAAALQRVTLGEKATEHLQRLTALRILNLAVSGSLELDKTLNVLLDQITNQLHVDAADIYLYDADTHLLKHAARSGFWTNYRKYNFLKIGEGLPGRIAREPAVVQIPCISERKEDFLRLEMIESERFVSYYAVPLISKGQVKGVLELFSRRPAHFDDHWINFLETLAAEAAVAIDNAELIQQIQSSNDELTQAYDATIQGWSRTLELRDHETKGHSDRVVDLTLELAQEMGIPENELLHIRRGAMLHDIGKTGIPDSILLKTGPLNGEETGVIQLHPVYARRLLSGIPFLQPAMDIPYCHHEKWDGTGYPQGLRGEAIPFAARIFAVVDVYDALSHERPYREAWTQDKVLEYIEQQCGKHFDPNVVPVFLKILKERASP